MTDQQKVQLFDQIEGWIQSLVECLGNIGSVQSSDDAHKKRLSVSDLPAPWVDCDCMVQVTIEWTNYELIKEWLRYSVSTANGH